MIYSAIRSLVGSPLRTSLDRAASASALSDETRIATLFAGMGAPRLWLDPANASARFQDVAGATPATTSGQPVGRLLDVGGGANHVGQSVGASSPLYQSDGLLHWLQFDGANDSLYGLANLDLTSTNKVTVIAGVKKDSDLTQAVVAELSALSSSNPGAWVLFAPPGAGTNTVQYRSGGTAVAIATGAAASPITQVLTGITDISAPFATLRTNGVVAQTTAGSQGTGNLGSYLLNVGRRNNATLPFAGRIYGLMVIGRLLTADELILCERFMAARAGIAF